MTTHGPTSRPTRTPTHWSPFSEVERLGMTGVDRLSSTSGSCHPRQMYHLTFLSPQDGPTRPRSKVPVWADESSGVPSTGTTETPVHPSDTPGALSPAVGRPTCSWTDSSPSSGGRVGRRGRPSPPPEPSGSKPYPSGPRTPHVGVRTPRLLSGSSPVFPGLWTTCAYYTGRTRPRVGPTVRYHCVTGGGHLRSRLTG